MGDQLTPPATPATPSEPAAPPAAPAAPERLPGDHPLVTALAAQKQKNAELQQQIDAGKKVNDPKPAPKPEPGGDDVSERIAALEQQLADEKAARSAAEVSALRTRLGAGLPTELVELLTGTTEDEIKAQVDKLAPLVKGTPGPAVQPQQGLPPGKTGGSVTAGRDRYKAAHNN
ncbi:capsid assembly scaffolding protein Gp46 family protein [Gordonia malaquae]|uniref:capsid assembly scaffolding protein Gp46 family protein n=1 Tax=Gordonia malaquae TaxID=410332 RepID=UPI003019CE42